MLITQEELERRQALPFKDKMDLSAERIEKWYDYWQGKVYVSFSGGRDSTVLLHLVRSIFPEVPAVFINTGLEYPEIIEFVKNTENVTWIRPKMSFRQVLEKYGYPVVSKEQSKFIYDIRNTKSEKLMKLRMEGNVSGVGRLYTKYLYLVDAPFKISDKCCDALKKRPAHIYEKETGRKAFLGTRTEESKLRERMYLTYGCNLYTSKRPISTPLSFWTEQDIKIYLFKYRVPYSRIYDMGYDRTGCMFCMYGVKDEWGLNKFQRMKLTHPQLYKYCIDNLGCGKVLEYMDVQYGKEKEE